MNEYAYLSISITLKRVKIQRFIMQLQRSWTNVRDDASAAVER